MNRVRLLAVACVAGMVVTIASATSAQDKCINAMIKDANKVASKQAKEVSSCIKNIGKGKAPASEACLIADPKGKVNGAKTKTTDDFAKKCAPPPIFGPGSSSYLPPVLNQAAMDKELAIKTGVFGADIGLPNVIVPCASSKDDCKCQQAIAKDMFKLQAKKLKECGKAVKAAFKAGSITDGATLSAACLNGILTDAKGKIAGAQTKLGDDITKKCPANPFVDGDCSSEPVGGLAACVDKEVECEVCQYLKAIGVFAASVDCDLFDDGIANASCGAQPHKCTFDETVDNSDLDLRVQGNVSLGALVGNISGAIDIACPPPSDVNGKRACTCTFQTWTPVSVTGIGIVCIDPGVCPPGEVDCDGGNALGIDAIDDPDIGLCTSNADCSTQCDAFCAGISKVQWRSGCERFCQGGTRNNLPCICDAVGTGGCVGGTAGVDDCPGGSCVGKQNEADSDCQCQCIDYADGGASSPGDIQCNLGTDLKVVASLPCSNPALVDLPPVCGAVSSQQTTGFTQNANADDGAGFTIGPNVLTGSPETCANLDLSTTTGFDLITDIGFFDSAIGDLRSLLRIDCQ